MKTYLFGAILIVLCSINHGNAQGDSFSEGIILDRFTNSTCFQNIYELLESTSIQEKFKLKDLEVLYLSYFGGYNFHVVLKYKDFIIDGHKGKNLEGSKTVFKKKSLQLIALEDYFMSEVYYFDSEVKIIPAKYFKDQYKNELSNIHFLQGFKDISKMIDCKRFNCLEVKQSRFPVINLNTYLEKE